MEKMINDLAERMLVKARVINMYARKWSTDERRFTESRELNKFDHEFSGMIQAIKAMGITIDIEYDEKVIEMTAINLMGKKFLVL